MKNLLVCGAGKSSLFLIEYLLRHASTEGWIVTVADASLSATQEKIAGHPSGRAISLDATDASARRSVITSADVVLSLLPPTLHALLARDCVEIGRSIITASYVSPEMRELDDAFRKKGLLAMCEMGLDPGIDHMSAMEVIHRINGDGGHLTAFRSYCGGLVAPESDDNPWHYKISWNPRNIVLAGQGGADFIEDGQQVHVPYEELFIPHEVYVPGLGKVAYYPNRNSTPYKDLYGLSGIQTLMRATLRYPQFMQGWHSIVNLPGLLETDDNQREKGETFQSWTESKVGAPAKDAVRKNLQKHDNPLLSSPEERLALLEWLGIFDEAPLPPGILSSADLIQHLLETKWVLRPSDKDLIAMHHEFEYVDAAGTPKRSTSSLVLTGEGGERTAMAKTVGLPMGILARMIMRGEVTGITGVQIPTMPEVYRPVLRELAEEGVVFSERQY